ncbi:hypothetical protein [Aquimarina sp. 2201CG14-23]|uniref:hypothetical protein n=1 Tax=Aquimarina mycalae TaxID=3040073 RepID=UPI00247822A7|nr:hypothetical protein [Aquimarina sp. 2201CG14-23]MDH7447542.1 hypothetical protein [Aquimarina sp. 2201CG14-23]
MRKKFILGVVTCMVFFACQQNDELTEIETTEAENTKNFGRNAGIPDLTFVDGTPVDYTIEDIEVLVIYEPGTTEAEKAQVRANNATEYGPVQVTPCPSNPNEETWSYRDLVIHNWEDAPYQILNYKVTDPILDPDIVEKAALRRIDYKTYVISDPSFVCD